VDRDVLEFYARPGRFTDVRGCGFSSADVGAVVDAVQGLLLYDVVAQPFYGVELPALQAATIHERDSAALLVAARNVDGRPLDEPRPARSRVGARCHTFSRMTVAFLRAAGVPARARCGFGAYFRAGRLEDHWVAEHWHEREGRWRMVDAQLDPTWRQMIGFTDDPMAITGEQFLTAGHAWQAWRRGDLDAGTCGLSSIGEHGPHWIAGNLRLDLASLNKVEMLPWDVWGDGWEAGTAPTREQLDLYDAVAALTVDPDVRFGELRAMYERDERLRMDGTTFNVLRGAVDTV
jgi:hypothetical protein